MQLLVNVCSFRSSALRKGPVDEEKMELTLELEPKLELKLQLKLKLSLE